MIRTSPLSPSRAGRKSLPAHRTLDMLKVDAPHFGRRNHLSTFRAYVIKRRPHFFEIDLPRAHCLGLQNRVSASLACIEDGWIWFVCKGSDPGATEELVPKKLIENAGYYSRRRIHNSDRGSREESQHLALRALNSKSKTRVQPGHPFP
jgi:hypothetical protein